MTNPIHEIAKDPSTPGGELLGIFRRTVDQHQSLYKTLPVDPSKVSPENCYIASLSSNPSLPTDLLLTCFCYYPLIVIDNFAFTFYELEDPGYSNLKARLTRPVWNYLCINKRLREKFKPILIAHSNPEIKALFTTYTDSIEDLEYLTSDPHVWGTAVAILRALRNTP